MIKLMHCQLCKGPFSPASGMVIGHPMEFLCCGRCWKEGILPLLKEMASKKLRVSTRLKREAKEKKEKVPVLNFYDYV